VLTGGKASLIMLVLLGFLVFIYHLGVGIYYLRGVETLPAFEFLYTAGFLCGVVWWLQAEARSSAVKRVYCPGLLVGIGWLIIIPYHLLKTRGIRGFIPLSALLGCFLFAYILAAVVYAIFSN
jgi:hypothetical protein